MDISLPLWYKCLFLIVCFLISKEAFVKNLLTASCFFKGVRLPADQVFFRKGAFQ